MIRCARATPRDARTLAEVSKRAFDSSGYPEMDRIYPVQPGLGRMHKIWFGLHAVDRAGQK